MKKLIIISGFLLLAVAASAQRSSREETRQAVRTHKSDVRPVQKSKDLRESSRPGRTAQRHNSETSVRREAGNRKPVNSVDRKTVRQRPDVGTSTGGNSSRQRPDAGISSRGRTSQNQGSPSSRYAGRERTETRSAGRVNGRDRQDAASRERYARERSDSRTTRDRNTELRRHYTTPNRRHVRSTHGTAVHYRPNVYHRIHYRVPGHVHVVWTRQMYREYRILYPGFRYWYYPTGSIIRTIPAYEAGLYIGDVRNVYGRVHEVWYSPGTDEYYLYFGGAYPYQDFTVILPGRDARRFNRFPETFFRGRYIWVTGLLSTFEGKPEILVRRTSQVHLY